MKCDCVLVAQQAEAMMVVTALPLGKWQGCNWWAELSFIANIFSKWVSICLNFGRGPSSLTCRHPWLLTYSKVKHCAPGSCWSPTPPWRGSPLSRCAWRSRWSLEEPSRRDWGSTVLCWHSHNFLFDNMPSFLQNFHVMYQIRWRIRLQFNRPPPLPPSPTR